MDNPYAPPKANVEGAFAQTAAAPPIWNPNAAASWCLLFTPIFGTWLHWKNWVALGETGRALSAKRWLVAAIVVTVGSILLAIGMPSSALGGSTRLINFAFLIVWYYAGAKPQVRYVKERFGDGYPHRGWGKPILWAIGTMVAAMFLLVALVIVGARVGKA